MRAILSSTYGPFVAAKCIDGNTDGPDQPHVGESGDLCHTQEDLTPWLAIDYGKTVTVQRVEIFNRQHSRGDRTRNVDVRISDELPTSGSEMFSGGTLLGHFAGPATNGQQIIISGETQLLNIQSLLINFLGQRELSGRYVIVQMDNGENTALNLKEVRAFDRL